MRGYNTRGDADRCCTKAPYYASNERAGEGGLEVGDQVQVSHLYNTVTSTLRPLLPSPVGDRIMVFLFILNKSLSKCDTAV